MVVLELRPPHYIPGQMLPARQPAIAWPISISSTKDVWLRYVGFICAIMCVFFSGPLFSFLFSTEYPPLKSSRRDTQQSSSPPAHRNPHPEARQTEREKSAAAPIFRFMTDLVNLQAKDPFAEDADIAAGTGKSSRKVHVRVQQRNGRKSITTIQGLSSDLDLKLILKARPTSPFFPPQPRRTLAVV